MRHGIFGCGHAATAAGRSATTFSRSSSARRHALLARSLSSFRAADAQICAAPQKAKPDLADPAALPFGRVWSDHQLEVWWDHISGWAPPQLGPQRDVPVHPAALGVNHGVSCFEGMKAFAGQDGMVRLFRPELNMARLLRSAHRLALPGFDPE